MDDHTEEHFEEEFSFLTERHLKPRLFEGEWQNGVPEGFDAVTLYLDGRTQVELDWKKAREQALQAVEKGYLLLWDMDLGLFDRLAHPLSNQTQFLSLTLSLEHFRDSLWKEFKQQTIGLSLYRGQADFSRRFPWDHGQEQNLKEWLLDCGKEDLAALSLYVLEQQAESQQLVRLFCRDVAIEYLSLLASRLPDDLLAYLYLDASSLAHAPLHQLQLLNPERFNRLHLALKGQTLPFQAWGWHQPTMHGYSGALPFVLPHVPEITIGICVPSMSCYHSQHYQGLDQAIRHLQERQLPFKLIAETHLTAQWDGLDYILYAPAGLSVQGKRKLQGFCAAGGTVVSTQHLLELPSELSLNDWLSTI